MRATVLPRDELHDLGFARRQAVMLAHKRRLLRKTVLVRGTVGAPGGCGLRGRGVIVGGCNALLGGAAAAACGLLINGFARIAFAAGFGACCAALAAGARISFDCQRDDDGLDVAARTLARVGAGGGAAVKHYGGARGLAAGGRFAFVKIGQTLLNIGCA